MQSYQMLIDGRLDSTPEQDNVINPSLGAPFASSSTSRTLRPSISSEKGFCRNDVMGPRPPVAADVNSE